MNKVSIFKFFKSILIIITFVFAAMALLAGLAPFCDTREYNIMPFIGLAFPVIIGINIIFTIYWVLKKTWIVASIVFLIILLNVPNINAVYQAPICRSGIDFSKPKPPSSIRIVSYNVAEFKYTKPDICKFEIAKFLFTIDADIVCLQEYRGGIYSSDTIIGNFNYFPYKTFIDKAPGRLRTAILSKYPILKTEQITYDNSNNTGIYSDLNIGGQIVRVFSIHFQTTNVNQVRSEKPSLRESINSPQMKKDFLSILFERMNENGAIRADQADKIRSITDTTDYPVIIGCDMNEMPVSFVYKRVKGNLNDGFVTKGKNYGYTYNSFFNLLRIDYVLYSDNFEAISYSSPKKPWSDHKPVVMDFKLFKVKKNL